MAYAPGQWASTTIANGATNSATMDLGRVFDLIQFDIPAVNTCAMSLKVCKILAGTFNTLGGSAPTVNVGVGSCYETFRLGGYQYVQLISSVTQNANRSVGYRGIAI